MNQIELAKLDSNDTKSDYPHIYQNYIKFINKQISDEIVNVFLEK